MSAASIFDQPAWAKASAVHESSHYTKLPSVICACFNNDGSIMLAGTDDGFIIYSLENASATADNRVTSAAANNDYFHNTGGGVGLGKAASSQQHQHQHPQQFENAATVDGVGTSDTSALLTARQEVTSRVSNAMREICRRTLFGGVGRAAMCEKSNLLLLSGASPETSLTVTLWDDGLYNQRLATQHYSACQRTRESAAATKSSSSSAASAQPAAAAGRTNNIATTGGVAASANPPHIIAQLSCDVPVRGLRINPFCIIVVDTISVSLYDRNLSSCSNFPTVWTKGFSQNNSNTVDCSLVPFETTTSTTTKQSLDVVCLGRQTGQVRLIEFIVGATSRSEKMSARELLHTTTETLVQAHNNTIHTIAVASAARIAATVSESGTAIKVIDLERKAVLRQLSRGNTVNRVPTLALSADGRLCICVSESGTLHCFWTSDNPNPVIAGRFGMVGGPLPPTSPSVAAEALRASPGSRPDGHRPYEDAWTTGDESRGMQYAFVQGGAYGGGSPAAMASPVPSTSSAVSARGAISGIFGAPSRFLPQSYQNMTNYLNSHASLCSTCLLDPSADVEAYSHHYDYDAHSLSMPLTAAYSCSAVRPPLIHGKYTIVVVIGGLSSQAKARCLHVDLDYNAEQARRMATFIFPRDPL